jgi:hypothetical protein
VFLHQVIGRRRVHDRSSAPQVYFIFDAKKLSAMIVHNCTIQ